jgi:hypothetical protein
MELPEMLDSGLERFMRLGAGLEDDGLELELRLEA